MQPYSYTLKTYGGSFDNYSNQEVQEMKKLLTIFLAIALTSSIFIGITFFSENASAATNVSGSIGSDTTWTAASSPYIVVGDVIVDKGVNLTINPGVEVKFDGLFSLIVNGTLNATGTPSQPIKFTSNQSSPAKGDWLRIRLQGRNNTLDYCEISYGNYPLYIMGPKTNNNITNCKIFNNTGDGIYLKQTTNNTIDNATVSFSDSNGITLLDSENNIINNSIIKDNSAFGTYFRSSKNNRIENTNISNNDGIGIKLDLNSKEITFKNLTVYGNDDTGIDLGGNGYNNIMDSLIIENNGIGINYNGATVNNSIWNTDIINNSDAGVDLQGSSNFEITGCNISYNIGTGVRSTSHVTNVNITNTEILYNLKNGISFSGATSVNISYCNITNNKYTGIGFSGTIIQENTVMNCTISKNNYGISFSVNSNEDSTYIQNNRIIYNSIYSNSWYNINFRSSASSNLLISSIQNNDIYSNIIHSSVNSHGIYIYNRVSGSGSVLYTQNNNIFSNTIYSNKENGVYFDSYYYSHPPYSYTQNNNIYSNKINLNGHNGIFFHFYSGDSITQHNNIYSNIINSNGQNGIHFLTEPSYSDEIYIQYNNIYSNEINSNGHDGIHLSIYYPTDNSGRGYLQDNDIYSNTVNSNRYYGLHLDAPYRRSYSSSGYSYIQNNNLYSNLISSNKKGGIHIHGGSIYSNKVYSQSNNIYSNSICSNGEYYSPGDLNPDLGNALDNNVLYWTTGGDAIWEIDTENFYYDQYSAKSGKISHGEETYLETQVLGPGTLSFRYYVSSEYSNDYLRFYIDSQSRLSRSGPMSSWYKYNSEIEPGIHTLKWTYIKDELVSKYEDACWIDNVEFSGYGIQTQNKGFGIGYGIVYETRNLGQPSGYSKIYNNTISNNFKGIKITDTESVIISSNNITNNWEYAINIESSQENSFRDNKIQGTPEHPIQVNSTSTMWSSDYNLSDVVIGNIDLTRSGNEVVVVGDSYNVTLLNGSDNLWDATTLWAADANLSCIATGNFYPNNPGNELLVGDTSGRVSMVNGNGTSWTNTTIYMNTSTEITGVAAGDFNMTHKGNEIVAVTAHGNVVEIFWNGTQWNNTLMWTDTARINDVAIGHFDHLSKSNEVVVAGESCNVTKINGSGNSWVPTLMWNGTDCLYSVTLGEVDPDNLGIEVIASGVNNVTKLNGTGNNWTAAVIYNGSAIYYDVGVGEITNKINGLEVLIVSSDGEVIMLNASDSAWTETIIWKSNEPLTSMAVGNVNNSNFAEEIILIGAIDAAFKANGTKIELGHQTLLGINLTSDSNNNVIMNNNISRCVTGVHIEEDADSNLISRNDILDNSEGGVSIIDAINNEVHHNNFKNNSRNGFEASNQLNDWDDGSEGNWWDDYTGFDGNSDGIGDIPYDVAGGGSKDWYPLMDPVNIDVPLVVNTTPKDSAINVSLTTQLSITFSKEMNRSATENATTLSGGITPTNFIWSNGNQTVTFDPSAILNSSTIYVVTISLDATNLFGNPLPSEYQFSFTTIDILAPTIISTSPANGTMGVTFETVVVVTFSEPMDTGTVTYSCLPDPGGWGVSWNINNTQASYSHTDFGGDTNYIFWVTGGKDLVGNNLTTGITPNPWTFSTADVEGPEITSTYPASGAINVLLNYNIVINFNEQMNTSSVTYSCNPNPGGWLSVWSNGNTTVTYSHNTFDSQTTYTFQITNGKDIAGNTLNPSIPNPWSFSTVDKTAPELSLTTPANTAVNVLLSANIIVTFDEAMNDTSVTHTCTPDPGGWSVIWSGGKTMAAYSHNPFSEQTTYTFQITGGKDVSGNTLASSSVPNPWTFTTQDITAPQIIAASPNDGSIDIPLDMNIIVTFGEAMDTSSITYTCSPEPDGWSVSWSAGDTVAAFSHNSFGSSTTYTIQITAAKDIAGNNFAAGGIPNPWTFTTIDAIAPTIISTSPLYESTNILKTSNVIVTFSEAMDTSTVTFSCSPNPAGWSISWSAGDMVATFMHDPLVEFTEYTFHITSGKDIAGNNLVPDNIPNPWAFTTGGNSRPSIQSEPIKIATEDKQYAYDVDATDVDQEDILTFSLQTAPTGMTINGTIGLITWTPTNEQVGTNPVVILVSDGKGGTVIQAFEITVSNANDEPIITSTPITSATEDVQYSYTIEAQDIDTGDTLRYALTTFPLEMTIDTNSGLITWTPTNDQVGANSVTVKVIDNHNGKDAQSFTITVANTNDAPEIISSPVTSGTEDSQYNYEVMAEDPDPTNDKLTFSLNTYPTGMVIHRTTGIISWTPTNDQVGSTSVVVQVSDGKFGMDTQTFVILVSNVNDPPTIVSTPVTTATEDEKYTYDVEAQDMDIGDKLTFGLATFPIGMVIDSSTGLITWTPSNDQIGASTVEVEVIDDHGEMASSAFTITVANINDPPGFESIPKTSATADTEYMYSLETLDIDPTNDKLSFSLTTYPDGMNIDPATGVITWTPSKDQAGSANVVVQISDGNGGSDSQTFTINVDPPVTSEKGETEKKQADQTVVYSLIGFIVFLVIMFVLFLFLFFKKKKPAEEKKSSENDKPEKILMLDLKTGMKK